MKEFETLGDSPRLQQSLALSEREGSQNLPPRSPSCFWLNERKRPISLPPHAATALAYFKQNEANLPLGLPYP
jgi:hypothetical protein